MDGGWLAVIVVGRLGIPGENPSCQRVTAATSWRKRSMMSSSAG
jgi:hypothetical protein